MKTTASLSPSASISTSTSPSSSIRSGSTTYSTYSINIFTLLILPLVVFFFFFLAKVTHYDERMAEINAERCAMYGYKADCTTPIK